MVAGDRTVFSTPGLLYRANVKVGYGPKCARASFKTITLVYYNNNVIAFLTAGLRKKSYL